MDPLLSDDVLWRIDDRPELVTRSYPKPRYRFDAPRGEYPSLYTCASDIGAFAESYMERGRRLGLGDAERYLLRIEPREPLPLIDFHDVRILALLNLDERISMGDDYSACQMWALAFHEQDRNICGIRYRARKAGALVENVFLFADRCTGKLDIVAATKLEELEAVVRRAQERYHLTVFFSFKDR